MMARVMKRVLQLATVLVLLCALFLLSLFTWAYFSFRYGHADFEKRFSQQLLVGKSNDEVIKIFGPPMADSRFNGLGPHRDRRADSKFFVMYKSRLGEYAVVNFDHGAVVNVTFDWQ